jgi:endogenous inhibitor of DNA gyrase (YacG/DUF329 family)
MPSDATFFIVLRCLFVQTARNLPVSYEDRVPQTGGRAVTDEHKERIKTLRREGWGYKKISAALCVSANTVKSFCRKEGLGGALAVPGRIPDDGHCRECGIPLTQTAGMKQRKFCSPECRVRWWARHPEAIRHKTVARFTCPACGKEFSVNSGDARKYCSHGCYIAARFRNGGRT